MFPVRKVVILVVCLIPVAVSASIDCGKSKYPCDSGDQCVERKKWCDKHSDCKDGSDEAYCKQAKWYSSDPNDCFEKADTHLYCNSGICVPIIAECDGYKDCEDGYDEKYCGKIEDNKEVEPNERLNEDYSSNGEETSFSTASTYNISPSTSEVPIHHKDVKQAITIPTTRVTHSGRVNGHSPTTTDYYDWRMKEFNSELKPQTFPKEIPTRAYVSTRSTSAPPQKTYTRNFAGPSTTTATPRSVSSRRPLIDVRRPQSTYSPRHIDQQRQSVNQRTNRYQPPINDYQLPINHYQQQINHYETPSSRYQPLTNRYQPPSNNYQPPSNSYRPPPNQYQPPWSSYRPSSNHHHSPSYRNYYPSNSYQPSSNHYQHSSNQQQTHQSLVNPNYNEHRPLNGQPDVRYQTNYFKPYSPELEVRRRFYFVKNYVSLYGRDNAQSIIDGVKWLLRQRSDSGDWDKDTQRAVVALALSSNNNFSKGDNDYEIMKRRFLNQVGANLKKNNIEDFNINRMFMTINGLLAVCEDPTDFHGIDLAELLRHKITENNKSYQNAFVLLSLCLSNKSLSSSEVNSLINQMQRPVTNERTKDSLIAAIMAFSCYMHQSPSDGTNYHTALRSKLREAVASLLNLVGEDGNFGSTYSTALAAQALISTNESGSWNADKTMSFLRQQQREDGSFGDFLATYFALPALSGRSLLHLRNINCNLNKRELSPKEILEFAGPKQYVYYSLYFGYPLINSQSWFMPLPKGINFLDVMRVAQYYDPNFRFTMENNSSKVDSLSGLPNDPEMGLSWHLYVKNESSSNLHEPNSREKFTGDLRSLSSKPGETYIFWYHSNDLQ